VLGSILPVIYNNGNEIVQAPGLVVIRNEMIHETRIVPLDDRAHLASSIKSYMGDSRGHWDGNTLVVETTNLNGRNGVGGNGGGTTSDRITLTERFTMLDMNTLQYEVTIDDPGTVGTAVDDRLSVEARSALRDVRVRVPRGQLRDEEYSDRGSRRRTGGLEKVG
jgi:hypothetical protein